MMAGRGIFVDHSTVHRWAIKIVPVLAAAFRRRQRPVGKNWGMDETYIKVHGQWKYLYRAQWIATATRSTFCCEPSVIARRRGISWKRLGRACQACDANVA